MGGCQGAGGVGRIWWIIVAVVLGWRWREVWLIRHVWAGLLLDGVENGVDMVRKKERRGRGRCIKYCRASVESVCSCK